MKKIKIKKRGGVTKCAKGRDFTSPSSLSAYGNLTSMLGSTVSALDSDKRHKSVIGGVLTGAGAGASAGAALGPYGALAGGVLGGALSAFQTVTGNKKMEEAQRREAVLKRSLELSKNYSPENNTQSTMYRRGTKNLNTYRAGAKEVEVERDELVLRKDKVGRFIVAADFQGGDTHEEGGEPYVARQGDIIIPANKRDIVMKHLRNGDNKAIDKVRSSLPKDVPSDNKLEDGVDLGGYKKEYRELLEKAAKDKAGKSYHDYLNFLTDHIDKLSPQELTVLKPDPRFLNYNVVRKLFEPMKQIASNRIANAPEGTYDFQPMTLSGVDFSDRDSDILNYVKSINPDDVEGTALAGEEISNEEVVDNLATSLQEQSSIDQYMDLPSLDSNLKKADKKLAEEAATKNLSGMDLFVDSNFADYLSPESSQPQDLGSQLDEEVTRQGGTPSVSPTTAPEDRLPSLERIENRSGLVEQPLDISLVDMDTRTVPTPGNIETTNSGTQSPIIPGGTGQPSGFARGVDDVSRFAEPIYNIAQGLSTPELAERRYIDPNRGRIPYRDTSASLREQARTNARIAADNARRFAGGSAQVARANIAGAQSNLMGQLGQIDTQEQQRALQVAQANARLGSTIDAQNVQLFNQYEQLDAASRGATQAYLDEGVSGISRVQQQQRLDKKQYDMQSVALRALERANYKYDEFGNRVFKKE